MIEALEETGWQRDGKDDATVIRDFFRSVVPKRMPPRFNIMGAKWFNESKGWKKGDEITFVVSGSSGVECAKGRLSEDTKSGPPEDDPSARGRFLFDANPEIL
jgi:hypothetical protein